MNNTFENIELDYFSKEAIRYFALDKPDETEKHKQFKEYCQFLFQEGIEKYIVSEIQNLDQEKNKIILTKNMKKNIF